MRLAKTAELLPTRGSKSVASSRAASWVSRSITIGTPSSRVRAWSRAARLVVFPIADQIWRSTERIAPT